MAALDILSTCNFVNYFGKNTKLDEVEVAPILMQKGKTKLAIYGLGNIRDERLNRIFASKKVKFLRPQEDPESWFHVFVLHQNRIAHSPKNFIQETMLPDWMNLVVWGHEHECNIVPIESAVGKFRITQPGSSVATSLSEYESKRKNVALLQIHGTQFRLFPLPLRTVRPFLMDEIVLSSVPELQNPPKNANINELIAKVLNEKVEEMIKRVREEDRQFLASEAQHVVNVDDDENTDKTDPRMPLIRLKVEYSGFSTMNAQRFGKQFVKRVANPADILLFYRRKTTSLFGSRPALRSAAEAEVLARATRIPDPIDQTNMEELISSYLGQEILAPHLLVDRDFQEALHKFVEKEETDAFAALLQGSLNGMQQFLEAEKEVTGTEDPKQVLELMAERTRRIKTERAENDQSVKFESQRSRAEGAGDAGSEDQMDVDAPAASVASKRQSDTFKTPTKPAKASGKATAAKGRGAKAAATSVSAPNSTVASRSRARILDDEDEQDDQNDDLRAPPLDLNAFEDDDVEAQNLMITPKATPRANVKPEPAKSVSPRKTPTSALKRKAAALDDEEDDVKDEEMSTPPAKRAKIAASASNSAKKAGKTGTMAIDLTDDDDDVDEHTTPAVKKSIVGTWKRKT